MIDIQHNLALTVIVVYVGNFSSSGILCAMLLVSNLLDSSRSTSEQISALGALKRDTRLFRDMCVC